MSLDVRRVIICFGFSLAEWSSKLVHALIKESSVLIAVKIQV